jgi:MerR family transcriptional regulator, light-induced transcriptional regulator
MRYSVKAASMATGISESRLRTWERRYGIPHPPRSDTGRRLYSDDDLATIRRMAALVSRGVPASEAAIVAASDSAPEPTQMRAAPDDPALEQILAASGRFDEEAIRQTVASAEQDLGIAETLDLVIMPGLRRIGDAWGDQTLESGNEHFASEVFRREIARRIAEAPPVPNWSPSIVLACAEGERHDLGLLGLSLLLRERGIRVIYLGADVPAVDLARATATLRPNAVCLAAVLPGSLATTARALRALATGRQQPRLFAGGPALAASRSDLGIPAVRLPQSLAAATNLIVDSLAAV